MYIINMFDNIIFNKMKIYINFLLLQKTCEFAKVNND